MATVEQVAREVLAAIDTQAGHLLAVQWVSERYRRLCSRSRFRHLRRLGEVVLPAVVTTGTVTTTNGSRTVTGDATAQAAWSNALVDRMFRASVAWYRIASYEGTTLTLASPFSETAVTAGAYTIAPRMVRLADDARWISDDMVHLRSRQLIRGIPRAELDFQVPDRYNASDAGPVVWAGTESAADGTLQVEFYPVPTQDELIAYVYWAQPPMLRFDETIPPQVPDHVLREGALIDAMRYEAAKAMRMGALEQATYWRNEYQAQSTRWERDILDAIRADRDVDDVTFILQSRGLPGVRKDVTTAREMVYDRWQ